MRNFPPQRWLLIASCGLAVAASSCGRRSQSGAFVARVSNQYLTPEKVMGSLDTTARVTEPQVRDFVTEWVNSALLYEEARVRGLDRGEQVNETLEEMRRQLAVNRLLESEVYGDQSLQASDEEMRAYYEQHKGDYLLGEDVAKIRFVRFATREAAVNFHSQLLKNKSWFDVLQTVSADSVYAAAIIERVDSEYVKQSTSPSPEIWKAITQLHLKEVSQVLRDDMGYYVTAVLGLQRAGEIAEFPLVASEARDRTLVEKRQKVLNDFLERLKKKYTVQVNLSALETADTAKAKR